jgi:hypothetical protein
MPKKAADARAAAVNRQHGRKKVCYFSLAAVTTASILEH